MKYISQLRTKLMINCEGSKSSRPNFPSTETVGVSFIHGMGKPF